MHYNENSDRDQATTAGQAVFKFIFPKSKKGECTAKPVKTDPIYSKMNRIQHTGQLDLETAGRSGQQHMTG